MDHGVTLDYGAVTKGLRELNPQITFDAAVNRPQDYRFLASWAPTVVETRAGVYYNGKHVCSIDRGVIPEYAVWEMIDGMIECPMVDIEKYDETRVLYLEILKTDPRYHEALTRAQAKDDQFTFGESGKLFLYQAFRPAKVRGNCLRVGWRHTFGRLVKAKVPGITLDALAKKFNVDMSKAFVGKPEEL